MNKKIKIEETKETIEINNDLEAKILEITMLIRDKYPELSKFLEESPVTIPVDDVPDINRLELHNYYETLNSMLKKYIAENPQSELKN